MWKRQTIKSKQCGNIWLKLEILVKIPETSINHTSFSKSCEKLTAKLQKRKAHPLNASGRGGMFACIEFYAMANRVNTLVAMLVLEAKLYGKNGQYQAIDEAIRTSQVIRNKCIRHWMDNTGVGKYDLSNLCTVLASEFSLAKRLGSQARQSAGERAWSAISRFYDNCKKKVSGKKGFPSFKKNCRSVEYKTAGWKLSDNRNYITFSDKMGIGTLKLRSGYQLDWYPKDLIK